jgi:hypothetical protein
MYGNPSIQKLVVDYGNAMTLTFQDMSGMIRIEFCNDPWPPFLLGFFSENGSHGRLGRES